jgi:hypothetical protein
VIATLCIGRTYDEHRAIGVVDDLRRRRPEEPIEPAVTVRADDHEIGARSARGVEDRTPRRPELDAHAGDDAGRNGARLLLETRTRSV